MKLQESGENYLETILILSERNGQVRSVDIATTLNYSKPSVSRAVSILKSNSLIAVAENGNITLTEQGYQIAQSLYERHRVLTDYFIGIGVSAETAAQDACRIEHIISDEAFEKIKALSK